MRSCASWLAVPVLVAGLVPLAGADGRITVPPEVVAADRVVRLRDVASLSGPDALALADVELGAAPPPGESRTFDGRKLLALLTAAGLDPQAVTYTLPETLRVRRAMQELAEGDVRRLVEDDLGRRLGAGASDATLRSVEITEPIRIAPGPYTARVVAPPGMSLLGRVRLELEITQDGRPTRTAWVTADIERFGPVVVAVRPLARGAVVDARDLVVDRQELSELPRDVEGDVAAVVGRTVRAPILAYTPIRPEQLGSGVGVRRGDAVELVAERGQLRISAAGEAKQDAALGENVAVVNRSSGKALTGRVVDAHTVAVDF